MEVIKKNRFHLSPEEAFRNNRRNAGKKKLLISIYCELKCKKEYDSDYNPVFLFYILIQNPIVISGFINSKSPFSNTELHRYMWFKMPQYIFL